MSWHDTSRPFSAQYNSDCSAENCVEGGTIVEDDEIVMTDGEAMHKTCAVESGLKVPE